MPDQFPNIDEFGRGSCTCNGTMTGCAVCSTANVLIRWKKPIPRLPDGTPNMRELGRRMGARHRAVDPQNRHGLSLLGHCTGGTNWCAYCAYLELKANNVPVAYGVLSWPQIEAHAKARHAVVLPGRYGAIPVVSRASYSATAPARGRSDTGFTGAHMMVLWGVAAANSAGTPTSFFVSDSDFGSPARPIVPPHSIIGRTALRNYWTTMGGWGVCYTVSKPPTLAVALPYGAVKYSSPLRFKARVQCNERRSPYVRSDNINSVTKTGTAIGIDRYTKAGTNVGGSSTWYGTADGNEWYHSSVLTKVGPATGTETIR